MDTVSTHSIPGSFYASSAVSLNIQLAAGGWKASTGKTYVLTESKVLIYATILHPLCVYGLLGQVAHGASRMLSR